MRRLWLLLALAGCATLDLERPLGSGVTDAPQGPLVRSWETAAGAAFGSPAALVTRDHVVFGTRKGEVVVMDAASGKTRGSVEVGGSVEGELAVSDDGRVLYVPTAETRGGVVAYDVVDGQRRWRWRGGGIQGGVVRVGGRLVTATQAGLVVGLDAETGEEVWQQDSAPGAQVHAAPVALDASVVVVDDRGRAVAVDPASGARRWTAELEAPVYATPTASGDLFVTTTRGRVARLDAATGRTVWAVDDPGVVRGSSPLVAGERVVVGFSDGTVRSMHRDTGAEVWRANVGAVVSARPALAGGRVLVGTMGNRLVALDAESGAETWSAELRGRVKTDLSVGGGRVYAMVEPGHVIAFGLQP